MTEPADLPANWSTGQSFTAAAEDSVEYAVNWLLDHARSTVVTPQMYGCAGDGVTDDTANLSACLNSGYPVLLLGKFRITSTITVALSKSSNPQGLYIEGAGGMQSQIILDNTAASLVITIGAYDMPVGAGAKVTLANFRITPNVAAISGYALTISSASAEAGSTQPNFAINNVDVTPASSSFYCAGGFMLQDVRYGIVQGCNLDGNVGFTAGSGGNGITFYSAVNRSAPCNIKIIGCSLAYWEKGIEFRPKSPMGTPPTDPQGLYVIATDILYCNYGIYATTLDITGCGLTVADCMINHGTAGVYTQNVSYCDIHDCFFLSFPVSGVTIATGIFADVTVPISPYSNLHDNLFNFLITAGSIATRRGIVATGGGAPIRTNVNNNVCLDATAAYTIAANNGGSNSGNASYGPGVGPTDNAAVSARAVVTVSADETIPAASTADVIAAVTDGVSVTLPDATSVAGLYTVKALAIDTVALLHCDGTNGSSTFTDSSTLAANFTSNNGAVISTAQSMFGGASANFPNNNSYLSASGAASNYAFGTADFTIEMWAYAAALNTGNNDLYDQRLATTSSSYPFLFVSSSTTVNYFVNGVLVIAGGIFTTSTWHHVALCRASGNTRLFLDGVQIGSTWADSTNYGGNANRPIIGNSMGFASNWPGYIDEVRITNGYARYTAAFTPPTAAFDTGLVTVHTTSSQTIDGSSAAFTIPSNDSIDFLPINGNWVIV